MPSFLNPLAAAIAAAVVIPSLLLLYFLKLRRREVVVPSTLLWKKAIQDLQVNAPFQKLRKNLLLLLQLLLLLLLLLALARPVVNHTPGAGMTTVILIDRSASMATTDLVNNKSRLDEARRQAKELVDTLGKDASAMVIAFDDSADIVQSFTSDRAILKNAIDGIQPTHRPSRLKTAYQLAEAKSMAFHTDQLRPGGPRPEIWLYSDGRVLDRNELNLRYAELKKFIQIGTPNANNVGIVALSARRNFERPAEVQIFARLANYGPNPADAVVQLSIDGAVPPGGIKRGIRLLPERLTAAQRDKLEKEEKSFSSGGAEFTVEVTKAAVMRVELKENPGDQFTPDDSAQVILPPPRTLKVAMVSREGNLWLENFLRSSDLSLSAPDAAAPGQAYLTPNQYIEGMKDPQAFAGKYDVLIFDHYSPQNLPPVGNFIYFHAVPPDSKLKAAGDEKGPELLKDQVVLDWDRQHPILRGTNLRFGALETLKLEVPLEAQTLIEGRRGPLCVLYREGRLTHLVFSFDVQNSDWPTRPSFPVAMDNALQYLALGSDMNVRQSFSPGTSVKVPRLNLQQAGAALREVVLKGPPGFNNDREMKLAMPEAGDFALPPLERVGVYELQPPIPQFEKLAVNLLDENESNLIPVEEAPGGGGSAVETVKAGAGGKARLELWWWIVAALAIPLCLIEWWVYTRRMHL